MSLFESIDHLCPVRLHFLLDLLEEEDIVLELLPSLLDTPDTAPFPAVQLLQVLLNAQLDSCLDLLIMALER